MNGMGPAMMAFMGLATLAVLAVLAALVVGVIWLARHSFFAGRSEQSEKGEDVLRRRYAAGEIDDDEYRQRLAMLGAMPQNRALPIRRTGKATRSHDRRREGTSRAVTPPVDRATCLYGRAMARIDRPLSARG